MKVETILTSLQVRALIDAQDGDTQSARVLKFAGALGVSVPTAWRLRRGGITTRHGLAMRRKAKSMAEKAGLLKLEKMPIKSKKSKL